VILWSKLASLIWGTEESFLPRLGVSTIADKSSDHAIDALGGFFAIFELIGMHKIQLHGAYLWMKLLMVDRNGDADALRRCLLNP